MLSKDELIANLEAAVDARSPRHLRAVAAMLNCLATVAEESVKFKAAVPEAEPGLVEDEAKDC